MLVEISQSLSQIVNMSWVCDSQLIKNKRRNHKYSTRKYEITRLWKMKKMKAVPIINGTTLGTISEVMKRNINERKMKFTAERLQKYQHLANQESIRPVKRRNSVTRWHVGSPTYEKIIQLLIIIQVNEINIKKNFRTKKSCKTENK